MSSAGAGPLPAPKTLAEHREMLVQMVRLKLHMVHRHAWAADRVTMAQTLNQRVDIWRKTDLNPGGLVAEMRSGDPRWVALVEQVVDLLCAHRAEERRDAFEDAAMAVFQQRVEDRVALDHRLEQERHHLAGYDCGSLRFHHQQGDDGGMAFIHIANAIAPRSIFAEPGYLRDCLLRLLDAVAAHGGITQVTTHTWLNSHPAWLAHFPRQWMASRSGPDEDLCWHYGFWGQFINARGCFNHPLGAHLRATGRLPYPPRRAQCSCADLRWHLMDPKR